MLGDWQIDDVENGQLAIAKAQELHPSVVILDLVMPVMDGLVAARELSKLFPDLPLLMHTLHWSPQVELEAQKVGVRKVIPKADSKSLLSAIEQALAAGPPAAVAALTETIPAMLPPPEITALPPIASDSAEAASADEPEPPSTATPDEVPRSRPPT